MRITPSTKGRYAVRSLPVCRQCGSNPVALQRSIAARTDFRNVGRHFKSQWLSCLSGRRVTDRRFSEIKSLEEDNFLQFTGFRVYKCPVFGARGNGYNVSEVKDRIDRSNELYEQVAALGAATETAKRHPTRGARTDWTRCRSPCYMVSVGSGEPTWGPGKPFSDLPNGNLLPAKPGQA